MHSGDLIGRGRRQADRPVMLRDVKAPFRWLEAASSSPSGGKAPNDDRWLRRAMVLWIALAVAVTAKVLVEGNRHSVYKVFAAASHNWWADASLYAEHEGLDIYRYSPAFAVAFTPFALLPDCLGQILWNLLSIAVLVGGLRAFARDVLPESWPPGRQGAFLVLALTVSIRGIWSAQSNALLIALVMLGAAAVAKRRWWTAAILLAVPVYVKLWPIALVLLLTTCWPRQLVGRLAVPTAGLAVFPFLTRPPAVVVAQYQAWWVSLTGPQQGRWPGFRDLWTVWENLCPPVNRQAYLALQLGGAALVLAWSLWQRRRTNSAGHLLTLIVAMWAAWQLLLGPGTERLTYGIIAPAIGWAVLVGFAERRGRLLITTAWVSVVLFSSGDVEKTIHALVPVAPILLPLGVGMFVVWLVWCERGILGGWHFSEGSPTRLRSDGGRASGQGPRAASTRYRPLAPPA